MYTKCCNMLHPFFQKSDGVFIVIICHITWRQVVLDFTDIFPKQTNTSKTTCNSSSVVVMSRLRDCVQTVK